MIRFPKNKSAAILILLFVFSPFAFAETNVKTYAELLSAIVKVREETKAEIAQAVQQAKVREAWETGSLIEKHLAEHGNEITYGDKVIAKLAKRLAISHSQLNRMRKFSKLYASVPISSLSWHDYILLMKVSDSKKREALAAEADQKHWSYDHLAHEINQWRAEREGSAEDFDKLPEISQPPIGIFPWVMIDGKKYYNLGFSAFLEKARVPENEIPPGKGAGEENFHTYEARVTRVVDGDTFRARIQVGFGIVVEQRVRLKRIDAPEIQTEEGVEAKARLEKILARDHGRIVLQTFGVDQHGRTLANVWVQKKAVDQEMLDAALAFPMEN